MSDIQLERTAEVYELATKNGQLKDLSVRTPQGELASSTPVGYLPGERSILIDSDVYLKAAETGLGIFELDSLSVAECKQFMPIVEWIEERHAPRETPDGGVVYTLARSRLA